MPLSADDIFWEFDTTTNLTGLESVIGIKARNLCLLPANWRLPFFSIQVAVYEKWRETDTDSRENYINEISVEVAAKCSEWADAWPKGVILRSSAAKEQLSDKGKWSSVKLPADYNVTTISDGIRQIYTKIDKSSIDDSISILIQPLAPENIIGHFSNERRVSKTVNHWLVEIAHPSFYEIKYNSQRQKEADTKVSLVANCCSEKQLKKILAKIGKWCVGLEKGPTHLEFSACNQQLYLHQIDFEDEMADEGVEPGTLFRKSDFSNSGVLNTASILQKLDFSKTNTNWKKLDACRVLADAHQGSNFPDLFYISGIDLLNLDDEGKSTLVKELQVVTSGRVVFRTDLNTNDKNKKLNLPRSPTILPEKAVEEATLTLGNLIEKGEDPQNICFIFHRFIPAISSAFAEATPDSILVTVDSLWGVPDGLQYLPHDSFEYNTKLGKETRQTLRYKTAFIQEQDDGNWERKPIMRRRGRSRSLSSHDVLDIAKVTHQIAKELGKAVLVMWFCGIPDEFGFGRSLPWYVLDALDPKKSMDASNEIIKSRKKTPIQRITDLKIPEGMNSRNVIFVLDPEISLYREDEEYLNEIIRFCKQHDIPVEMSGSRLAHAFYKLLSEDVVVHSTSSTANRKAGAQTFNKLVRDGIPDKIRRGGESPKLAKIDKTDSRVVLLTKLMEEAVELKNAVSPEEVQEELADLMEVVTALIEVTGADFDTVKGIAEQKKIKRGGFSGGVVLLETNWTDQLSQDDVLPPVKLKDFLEEEIKEHCTLTSYASLVLGKTITLQDGDSKIKVKIVMTAKGLELSLEPNSDEIDNCQTDFLDKL